MKNSLFRKIAGFFGFFRSRPFPAQFLRTKQEWRDLDVSEQVLLQLREIKDRLRQGSPDTMRKSVPGSLNKVIFADPAGTAKILAASLLGKYTGKQVYRVDLSGVESKYIGETEKNLSAVLEKAGANNWILFFDEADALFGKRTDVKDSHDRYANQEVSYLLQRMQSFPGPIIFGTRNCRIVENKIAEKYSCIPFEND